jgi:hypothetical protein
LEKKWSRLDVLHIFCLVWAKVAPLVRFGQLKVLLKMTNAISTHILLLKFQGEHDPIRSIFLMSLKILFPSPRLYFWKCPTHLIVQTIFSSVAPSPDDFLSHCTRANMLYRYLYFPLPCGCYFPYRTLDSMLFAPRTSEICSFGTCSFGNLPSLVLVTHTHTLSLSLLPLQVNPSNPEPALRNVKVI